ncbi:MAG: BlaI/MecI/CopY family transcriptional regulator [candidate division Zixibacteria bacterium]|nr:BlaI/MecI/CopY family transcriptional regulator [candidate division Zixibacteria bacterium]
MLDKFLNIGLGQPAMLVMADGFGEENGYARTTILTLMERLRKKKYVTRKKLDGVFVYASSLSQTELMQNVIGRFVNKALGGSVSPLVAYLSEEQELSDVEIAKLREFVANLDKDGGAK